MDSTIHPGISQAISDMTILLVLLFFLLRPGEYANANTNSQSTPFTINDVSLCYTGYIYLNMTTSTATRVTLTQKNGDRGKVIGLCAVLVTFLSAT